MANGQMAHEEVGRASRPSRGLYWDWADSRRAILVLVAAVTLARLVYLALFCPYTLVEDEAFYWLWSKHLDLSYYSKGPGIAWLIAGGTGLLGDSEFAIRAPAALCMGVAALALAGLAIDALGSARAGFFAALCVLLAPAYQALGVVMTIDGPLVACWSLACWAMFRAVRRGSGPAWVLAGLCLGVGFLFKYTALLALPGFVACAIWRHRGLSPRWWAWALLALLVLIACTIPVIAWNQRHAWPTLAHLLGHLHVKGGDTPVSQGAGRWAYSPLWTIEFLAMQAALVGPALVLALLGVRRSWAGRRDDPARWRDEAFLIVCAVPLLLFYLGVSFIAQTQANWAIAAHLTLLPLAGREVALGMDDWLVRLRGWRSLPPPRPKQGWLLCRPETARQVLWHATLVVGVAIAIFLPRLDWVARGVDALSTLPGVRGVWPAAWYVPIGRVTGADALGAHADRLARELQSRDPGSEVFVMAEHYGRAATLEYYLPRGDSRERRRVLCASSHMPHGRRNQYDYWDAYDPNGPELLGRDALLVGGTSEAWASYFDRVEPAGALEGDGRKGRQAFFGLGFRGFRGFRGVRGSAP